MGREGGREGEKEEREKEVVNLCGRGGEIWEELRKEMNVMENILYNSLKEIIK